MENLVNSIYALQVPLQGFVLIQMIVTDADKAVSGKPGNHMVQGFCFIIGKGAALLRKVLPAFSTVL